MLRPSDASLSLPRLFRVAPALFVVASVALVVACRGPASSTEAPAPLPVVSSHDDSQSAPQLESRRRVGAASDGALSCGAEPCVLGEQVCCAHGALSPGAGSWEWRHACVERLAAWPPPGGWPDTHAEDLAPEWHATVDRQVAACGSALSEPAAEVELSYCDSSADCPAGQTCCRDAWTSAYSVHHCTRPGKDGRHACDQFEVCSKGGAACASPESRCSHGRCRREGREVACGDKICRAPKPVCCFDGRQSTCTAVDGCRNGDLSRYALECAAPQDCPRGMRCIFYTVDSACAGEGEWAHGRFLCRTAADCPTDPLMLQLAGVTAFKCVPHPQVPWLRQCVP